MSDIGEDAGGKRKRFDDSGDDAGDSSMKKHCQEQETVDIDSLVNQAEAYGKFNTSIATKVQFIDKRLRDEVSVRDGLTMKVDEQAQCITTIQRDIVSNSEDLRQEIEAHTTQLAGLQSAMDQQAVDSAAEIRAITDKQLLPTKQLQTLESLDDKASNVDVERVISARSKQDRELSDNKYSNKAAVEQQLRNRVTKADLEQGLVRTTAGNTVVMANIVAGMKEGLKADILETVEKDTAAWRDASAQSLAEYLMEDDTKKLIRETVADDFSILEAEVKELNSKVGPMQTDFALVKTHARRLNNTDERLDDHARQMSSLEKSRTTTATTLEEVNNSIPELIKTNGEFADLIPIIRKVKDVTVSQVQDLKDVTVPQLSLNLVNLQSRLTKLESGPLDRNSVSSTHLSSPATPAEGVATPSTGSKSPVDRLTKVEDRADRHRNDLKQHVKRMDKSEGRIKSNEVAIVQLKALMSSEMARMQSQFDRRIVDIEEERARERAELREEMSQIRHKLATEAEHRCAVSQVDLDSQNEQWSSMLSRATASMETSVDGKVQTVKNGNQDTIMKEVRKEIKNTVKQSDKKLRSELASKFEFDTFQQKSEKQATDMTNLTRRFEEEIEKKGVKDYVDSRVQKASGDIHNHVKRSQTALFMELDMRFENADHACQNRMLGTTAPNSGSYPSPPPQSPIVAQQDGFHASAAQRISPVSGDLSAPQLQSPRMHNAALVPSQTNTLPSNATPGFTAVNVPQHHTRGPECPTQYENGTFKRFPMHSTAIPRRASSHLGRPFLG